MMHAIRVLDGETVGQIAAGEIIERPASVVKELVENAVDANASRVTVSLQRGGLDHIEVADDGTGIPAEDLPVALRAHATSKLRTASDLERVSTLGFRGEGLASIAAISRVEIVSRRPGDELGARVAAAADRVGEPEPAAAPVGTHVTVRGLFENVPVRREYLRSAAAEFNRVSGWLSAFALAYPAITFTLRHDGKDVWVMPATGDPKERLAMVFGRDAAEALLPLAPAGAAALDGSLTGFISEPGNDRPDRRLQLLFVNGRLLRSTLLSGAWTAGYSTFAMIGRHAYGVLFLELPPDHVDPNVHPTKSDVRLRFGATVFDAARRAITGTLRSHAARRFAENVGPNGVTAFSLAPAAQTGGVVTAQSLFDGAEAAAEDVPGRRLRVLTQLDRTYVLASDGYMLLLVDQHAAHERVAYEAIVANAKRRAPSEPLLVPQTIELDTAAAAALDRVLDVVREGGLDIETFGDRTYRIVATPAGFGSRPFDLPGFLADLTDAPKQRDVRERIWASLACHSVTVAGERLEFDEMTTLVDRLQACANPMHCPHGRPTMVAVRPEEIARMFKRI
ncbi:MAG: DNA mismatch repair endonuclease MutL [Vulcanimicrobiaceae bacterium]